MQAGEMLVKGERGNGIFYYDFDAFNYIGGATLSPKNSRNELMRVQAGKVQNGRKFLVNALLNAVNEKVSSGSSKYTIGNDIYAIRMFWKYCDSNSVQFYGDKVNPIKHAFKKYVDNLSQQFRSGAYDEKMAGQLAWSLASLITEALDISSLDLIGRTMMPRINTGERSARYESLDLDLVEKFSADLTDVIESLSLERINGSYPINIEFSSPPVTYKYHGRGLPPKGGVHSFKRWSKKRIDEMYHARNENISFEQRFPLIQLRIQAECLRFIKETAMNLAPVIGLHLDQVQYKSYNDGYLVSGFKARAGHNVEVRIPKSYRPKFENYIKFRKTVYGSTDVTSLFPLFGRDGKESKYVATRGFRSVKTLFERSGRPFFLPSLLRHAKGQKILRLAITGGNLAVVASELQNTISVIQRSYLVGSQQMATVEFTKFLPIIAQKRLANAIRAGGDCGLPSSPSPIPNIIKNLPQPDCVNPAGCFFCSHYRAVKSNEYLHKVLSYRHYLRLRSNLPSASASSLDSMLLPIIERINDFVEAIGSSSERMFAAKVKAELLVDSGEYHSSWHGWIELLNMNWNEE